MDRYCGLDVHKDSVFACILNSQGEKFFEQRFGTLTSDLTKLRDTMVDYGCGRAAMESTIPIWRTLQSDFSLKLANPYFIKQFPDLTGKQAENILVKADITTNKNMVPFDSRSPFQTSDLRFGTAAMTTRGLKETDMDYVVNLIDKVLSNIDDEKTINNVKTEVNKTMNELSLFAW